MKNSKFVLKAVVLVVIVAILSVTLSACLKIGLKENNVISRLEAYGATVKKNMRSAPVIEGWTSNADVAVKNILYATYVPDVDSSAGLDGEDVDMSAYEMQELYVIYTDDKKSGDWVEEHCKAYVKAEENADVTAHWNVYRYDNIILVGDYRLLAVARQY